MQKTWIRRRHRVMRNIAAVLLYPFARWLYGAKADRFREQGSRAYLILMNHQTPFDQFFVGLSFSGPVYYLATEDIFSKGWISDVIRWGAAPIPIRKQTVDLSALRNCVKVAKEGGTIAIAPEGNRTYSGKTEYMSPAIATLARMLNLPVALYRIEGGYGVQPRWSDNIRRGRIHAYVSEVLEPDEYARLSDDELFRRIREGLMVNEGVSDGLYESRKRAEYLERAMYVCPWCGLSEFESGGSRAVCKKCGRGIEYGRDKKLTGVGCAFPFRYITEWYDYQNAFVSGLDMSRHTETPLYRDRSALYEVIACKQKKLLRKDAALSLYGDRIVIDEGGQSALSLPFSEIKGMAVLGKNKLNIYHGETTYQLKAGKRFNALKYMNFYFRYKDIGKGEQNGKFLGL